MRIADFIETHRDEILAEWAIFAKTCTPAATGMDSASIRDHAGEMLTVITADLREPQGEGERDEKSKGNAPETTLKTAAEAHGIDRAESGFTTEQMVSEYRALRASVLRLWIKQETPSEPEDFEDMMRFNEAIDQALAESITRYTMELDKSKDMFLAILGHDLKTPLGAIMMSSEFMLETHELSEPHRSLVERISRGSKRMNHMIGALLDFTRSRLGTGIPVTPSDTSMGRIIESVVDEICAAYPKATVHVEASGEDHGSWDKERLAQVIANLITNAVEHGGSTPVTVSSAGGADEVTVTVHNRGDVIPPERIKGLFAPMKPASGSVVAAFSGPSGNLGLGLYIAERIVTAHGGTIGVTSSLEDGTSFIVTLPRVAQVA